MEIKNLIESMGAVAGKAQFGSFLYRTKTKLNKSNEIISGGELSRYTLVLGANYLTLLKRSKLNLDLMSVGELLDNLELVRPGDAALVNEARFQILESLSKSILAHEAGTQSDDYTKKGMYQSLGGGMNLNLNDNTLQMFGLVQSKVVIEEGKYKIVNSAPLTVIKNKITKSLPMGRFREFAFDTGNIQTIKLNGNVLEIR